MARRVFYSFHFDNDYWRVQQVRNINALEGQPICSANAWEEVKRRGDAAIKAWIEENMQGRSCVVVLVGAETADRPWVLYEIEKGWKDGKGVLGIRIDRLRDVGGNSSYPGPNPFSRFSFTGTQRTLADIVPLKTPGGYDSKTAYASIVDNIETWIEEAIQIRKDA